MSFDLAKAMANGGKCQTRDGHPARIICTDRINQCGRSIVVLVLNGDNELIYLYRADGSYSFSSGSTPDDLVNMSVRRAGWVNICGVGQPAVMWATREDADVEATRARIACVRVEWEE